MSTLRTVGARHVLRDSVVAPKSEGGGGGGGWGWISSSAFVVRHSWIIPSQLASHDSDSLTITDKNLMLHRKAMAVKFHFYGPIQGILIF